MGGIMQHYIRDIRELMACVDCKYTALSEEGQALKRLCTETNETYLKERGNAYMQEYAQSESFRLTVYKLNAVCNISHCEICTVRKYCNTYINNSRLATSFKYSLVDLFCGAGGLSLGFAREGFKTVLANDIEECCVDTYAHNHPETPRNKIIQGDIRNVVMQLGNLVGESVDVVVGGPPCQGFSMANRQRLIDDPRNHLYKNYVEVVRKLQPRFFVMENVKGMLSVASQVVEDFQTIGYTVSYHVLNACNFGVPQNRERLIYIGNRLGIDNEAIFQDIFNISENLPEYALGDALYGLRPLEASRKKNATEVGTKESGYIIECGDIDVENGYITSINGGKKCPLVFNHKARYNNDRDIEIFGRLLPGDRSDDPKIVDIMPYARRNGIFKDKYYKLEADKICKTITAHMKFDCNMYIHPSQARGLTPREAARVQSYPDDYFFRGSYTKTYMQIGNSVPPKLGHVIAIAIKQYLDGNKYKRTE